MVHHVVNTLGWPSLRPLQQEAIEPVLAGEHALLLAPTAGGKTEAAIFPLLSRMLAEDWRGLSVLYLTPLKALLDNLFPRLERYARMVGRTTGLWHGDVSRTAKGRMLAEPPDILLTTPESLEVMLISRSIDNCGLFGSVKTVVIDEVHAFAGDDRGWHLLAVLERVARIAGQPLQRIGLSATVGAPEALLDWLRGGDISGAGRVVAPLDVAAPADREVVVDHVGTLDNAALVLSRMHRGEKRLVFADSRAAVESLAAALRERDVTTFVSHSSLSADERGRAAQAFAESRDCVIVATSTLELGLDVGDLDRVVQIDAPTTVASFLQRFGRTGRRPGATRNCLFLTLGDEALLQAAGLLTLWGRGWVEPVVPPPQPAHLLGQQIMALSLQEGRIGRGLWAEWIGQLPPFAELQPEPANRIVEWMVAEDLLREEQGMLSFGVEGEQTYGRRNFLELISAFTTEPLLTVFHGRRELGKVASTMLQRRQESPAVILLAGRSWRVTEVVWTKQLVFVEPSEERGRSRWPGGGPGLSHQLCQAMAEVVAGRTPAVEWSRRATAQLEAVRADLSGLGPGQTQLARSEGGRLRWWTFAGLNANIALAEHLHVADTGGATDLSVTLAEGVSTTVAAAAIDRLRRMPLDELRPTVSPQAVRGLKFNQTLPLDLAMATLSARLWDPVAVAATLSAPVRLLSSEEDRGRG